MQASLALDEGIHRTGGGRHPQRGRSRGHEGTRVVITGTHPLAGRHGVVTREHRLVAEAVHGGSLGALEGWYDIRTDGGTLTMCDPEDVEAETGAAPEVVPDPVTPKGEALPVRELVDRMDMARREAQGFRDRAASSRSPKRRQGWEDRARQKSDEGDAWKGVWRAWKDRYPEAAGAAMNG